MPRAPLVRAVRDQRVSARGLLHACRTDEEHPLPHALPYAPAPQPDGAGGTDRPGRHPPPGPPRRRGRARTRLAQRPGEHRAQRERRALPRVPRDPAQGLDRGPLLIRGQVLPMPRPPGRPEARGRSRIRRSGRWERARSGSGARSQNGWGICLGGPAPNMVFADADREVPRGRRRGRDEVELRVQQGDLPRRGRRQSDRGRTRAAHELHQASTSRRWTRSHAPRRRRSSD